MGKGFTAEQVVTGWDENDCRVANVTPKAVRPSKVPKTGASQLKTKQISKTCYAVDAEVHEEEATSRSFFNEALEVLLKVIGDRETWLRPMVLRLNYMDGWRGERERDCTRWCLARWTRRGCQRVLTRLSVCVLTRVSLFVQ